MYTRSKQLHGVLGRILHLLSRNDIRLQPLHIKGELNAIADRLSRTLQHNRVSFDPAALLQCKRSFDFDLFGSSVVSLAPTFPKLLHYRHLRLADCPPAPLKSVLVPPWSRILDLVSEAARGQLRCSALLILPLWPAQPWWPLILRLAAQKLWTFQGTPWLSPGGRRLPYKAVALWVGVPP